MTITRNINGIPYEIELTDSELYTAYCEKERQSDIEDIRCYLNERLVSYQEDGDCEMEPLVTSLLVDDDAVEGIATMYRNKLADCIGDTTFICFDDAIDGYLQVHAQNYFECAKSAGKEN